MNQIERRFFVTDFDRRCVVWRALDSDVVPSIHILQGYRQSPPTDVLRVRITNDLDAEVTHKLGSGVERDSRTLAIDLQAGEWLLGTCPHQLEKTRFFVDGWKLDLFDGPLDGLVIAEIELGSPEEKVVFPDWLHRATDITGSTTNLDLAKIASSRQAGQGLSLLTARELIGRQLPRIVLTGGPCSGKTTVMKEIKRELGDQAHCVPEVATIIISLLGVRPPANCDALEFVRFQRGIYRVQAEFEILAEQQAIADRKCAAIMDRGSLDSAAYLSSPREFEQVCNTLIDHELRRYDAVIVLDVPEQDVYAANAANNPARSENFTTAKILGNNIQRAWGHHPNLAIVRNQPTMEDKVAKTIELVKYYIRRWHKQHA